MRSKLLLFFAFCCFAACAAAPESGPPVTAILAATPDKIAPGKSADLVVKVRVLPLYHIYGLNKSGNENIPTTLRLQLPKGMKLKGEWKAPEPKKGKGKSRIYEDEVVFRATLAIDKAMASGKHTVQCEMAYQVCDEELCWPPAKLNLATEIEVVASK
jgi:DsbC/DsbD-like thiol-disulfide interchange protein